MQRPAYVGAQERERPVVAAIFAIVVGVAIAGFEGACGGGCSHAPPGVHVAFSPPLTTSDVASVTVRA